MTPLEKLLAEEIPDGTFGDSRPLRPAPPRRRTPVAADTTGPDGRPVFPEPKRPSTIPEAALRRRVLCEELDAFEADHPGDRRHLYAVPDTDAPELAAS